MPPSLRRLAVTCAVVATAVLSGCGRATVGSGAPAGPEGYPTLHQLNRRAEAVVLFVATDRRRVDHVGPVPFTVTAVRVTQVLRGQVPDSIWVRQLGDAGVNAAGAAPLLEPGTSYLAFLKRFADDPGEAADEYVVVGGAAGLFLDRGGIFTPLDPRSPAPSRAMSLTVLKAELGLSP